MAEDNSKSQRTNRIIILTLVYLCSVLVVIEVFMNVSNWLEEQRSALPPTNTSVAPFATDTPEFDQDPTSTLLSPSRTPTPSGPTEVPTVTLALEDEA